MKRPLDLRRSAIAGGVVALVLAAALAARSTTPLGTFVYVLTVAAAMALVAFLIVVAADRLRRRGSQR